jgi:very-short-patch-repair endonuclease
MSSFALLIIILVVVMLVVLALIKANGQGGVSDDGVSDEVWPFYAKKPLSQPEQILYFRLVQALPDHIILAQVQLSCLLGVKKGYPHQTWLNRINRMSVDFVVCNKDSSVVAVIELDDATHLRKDRQIADAKKDKSLGAAGIQVVRFPVKVIPDLTAIQKALAPKQNLAG